MLAVAIESTGASAQTPQPPLSQQQVLSLLQQMQQQIVKQQQEIEALRAQLGQQGTAANTAPQPTVVPGAPYAAPTAPAPTPAVAPASRRTARTKIKPVAAKPETAQLTPAPTVPPLRYLPVGIPNEENGGNLIPAIHLGTVAVQPYGDIRTEVIYDSSSPYGNAFPLPGFNPITNGPTRLPEFHVTASNSIFGTNVSWHDGQRDLFVSGKVSMDFDGNYSVNPSVNTLDRPSPELREGYGRLDWQTGDTTSLFLLAGQDWTPFGSSTLPNLLESNLLGAGFGTLWQRLPQARIGMIQRFGGITVQPEFAIVEPNDGNVPADLTAAGAVVPGNEGIAKQLGFGARQGSDSGRPDFQGRVVVQFQ